MLQWSEDVTWRTGAREAGRMEVIFSRRGRDAAVVRLPETWYGELEAPEGDALLHWLQRKGFVLQPCNKRLRLTLGAQTRAFPCVNDLDVHVLAGDEQHLRASWDTFVTQAPRGALVAHLCIDAQDAVLSPLAVVQEAPPPVQSRASPSVYPAWHAQLQAVWPLVCKRLEHAAAGPAWQTITCRHMRFALQPRVEDGPYRIESQLHDTPTNIAPGLAFAGARVQEGLAASGVGRTPQAALTAARGEAWERYALTRADLQPRVTPEALTSGIATRYFSVLSHSTPAGWVRATGVVDGAPRALPARYVYFQPQASATNTTGAAYADTLHDAIDAGRQELIERHALVRAWLGLGRSARTRGPRYRGARYYQVGHDLGLHTIVCVVRSSAVPYCAVGCAARADANDAADKALREALASMVHWSNEVARHGRDAFVARAGSLQNPDLLSAAMVWPARADGAQIIEAHLSRNHLPPGLALAADEFLWVDVGQGAVNTGAVAKVWHPDALPFPSYANHLRQLAQWLDVPEPEPLPLA